MSSQAGSPSVDRRLERMERALRRVERIHDHEPDPGETTSLALLRELQVAAQACLDTAATWLRQQQPGDDDVPRSFAEVFDRLVATGLVDADLGARLRGVADLRNRLVFDYVDDLAPDGGSLRAAAAENTRGGAAPTKDGAPTWIDDLGALRAGLFAAMRDFARTARGNASEGGNGDPAAASSARDPNGGTTNSRKM